jgi:uncharacterized protein (DUF362 family)
LLGAGTGVAAGGIAGWYGSEQYRETFGRARTSASSPGTATGEGLPYLRKRFTGKSVEDPNPAFALPGRYPGRVIEIHHPSSVTADQVQQQPVKQMIERGMMELTGAPGAVQAWQSMFTKGDRVGIKVNPVGYARNANVVSSISNFAVIMEIVEGLKSAGVGLNDIILFERYSREFREAGYEDFVNRELPGVHWYASSVTGGEIQTDLEGRDYDERGNRPDADPHVAGYDRDAFRKFDYLSKKHDPKDEASYRSHISKIITGDMVNKIITIPVLKDHRSSGITIALKNISHGMVNNVARTHAGTAAGENRCGDFIPKIVALEPIRKKVVLHITDGLIGCYEGGPGSWNKSWGTWEYKSLFFATDPVAMDHIGWDIIDAERARRGWAPVASMGISGNNRSDGEQFYLREPVHVELAGNLGLGIFDPARIEYRRIALSS